MTAPAVGEIRSSLIQYDSLLQQIAAEDELFAEPGSKSSAASHSHQLSGRCVAKLTRTTRWSNLCSAGFCGARHVLRGSAAVDRMYPVPENLLQLRA